MAWQNDYSIITSLTDNDILLIQQANRTHTVRWSSIKSALNICGNCTLNFDTTLAGTPGNVTETTLFTYSLTAATLDTDNDFIHVIAWGTVAANANNKTLRFKFGSTTFSSGTDAINSKTWVLESYIIRKAAGNQDMITRLYATNNTTPLWTDAITGVSSFQEPAENLNGAVTISITGQNGFAQASDIRYEGSLILLNS